jgi:hypothetical protein
MMPALACQVTPVFDEPETVAVNVCVPPAEMLVALGETVTVTPALLPEPAVDTFFPVPQAVNNSIAIAAALLHARRKRLLSRSLMSVLKPFGDKEILGRKMRRRDLRECRAAFPQTRNQWENRKVLWPRGYAAILACVKKRLALLEARDLLAQIGHLGWLKTTILIARN